MSLLCIVFVDGRFKKKKPEFPPKGTILFQKLIALNLMGKTNSSRKCSKLAASNLQQSYQINKLSVAKG